MSGTHSSLRTAAALTGVGAAAAATWAIGIERYLFTVREHELPVLPAGAAPIRALHLSDLHLAPWQNKKIAWVRQLADLAPDVVVLTGDMMGHIDAQNALETALKPLAKAAQATVFVHGSNDYYAPRFKNPAKYLIEPSRKATRTPEIDNGALTSMLTDSLGALNLNNRADRSSINGTTLEWYGLGDPHIKYDDAQQLAASIAALPELPDSDTADAADAAATDITRIGVVHAPYQEPLSHLTDLGVEAIFAGHTHGGQIRVPGIGALTSNSDLPPSMARGLDVWYTAQNAAFLNVSAGLGTSIYAPARFACRPEASLLTLTARA